MLEGANIKLSDITSQSANNFLQMIIEHDELTVEEVEQARHNRCKSSAEEFLDALTSIIFPLQRELFGEVLRVIEEQTRQIERIEAMVQTYTTEEYDSAAKALDTMPGIGRNSAEQILAETGTDMSHFPSASHLCAWAGVSPGNNERAGKRKSGKTRRGNKTLKKTLVQCATSAVKNKDSFFFAQYQRLVVRKGAKKAVMGSLTRSSTKWIWQGCGSRIQN